jgi:MFS transporter, PAT family, beta-lactamase induction signal transducer AmpG
VGHNRAALAIAIGFEAFASAGLGSAALTAYFARETDRRYSATQYALFSSLAVIPSTFANSGAGYMVSQLGWFNFFLVCAALAVPGLLLLPKVAPWKATT